MLDIKEYIEETVAVTPERLTVEKLQPCLCGHSAYFHVLYKEADVKSHACMWKRKECAVALAKDVEMCECEKFKLDNLQFVGMYVEIKKFLTEYGSKSST